MDLSNKINIMDDIFSSYLMTKNEKEFCRNTNSFLSGVSGKTILVSVIDNSHSSKEPFFGMRVFPSSEEIDQILSCLAETEDASKQIRSFSDIFNMWKSISTWDVEIDSRCFDRTLINFNPEELTAMLLHEIGHTMYSDKKVEQFYRAYQECKLQMSDTDKASAKILYFLYQIPLIMVCGLRNWKISNRDLREEIFADASVQKLGYGEYLVSAYKKIIRAYGSTSTGYTDDVKSQAEIERSITWCNLNAHDLVHRKNKLKDELYETGSSTNSHTIRNRIKAIMDQLSIRTKNRYTSNVVLESTLTFFDKPNEFVVENELIYDVKGFSRLSQRINTATESTKNRIANEALMFKKSKKGPQVPSQLDVDTIFVEVDRIQNHADQRYVLDLIYHQEEKIEQFKDLFAVDQDLEKRYDGKMESMLKELESMRKAVLAKRNFDKDYKVFVKYPKGYEG